MKTVGIVGGLSWESSVPYYRLINEGVRDRLGGGLHSARIILNSVDFAPLAAMQEEGRWDEIADVLTDAALAVQGAGADFVVLATNTMHKVAEMIEQSLSVPFLHIADAAGEKIVETGMTHVGLLGTIFTMEQDFFTGRLSEKFGVEVLVPEEKDRKLVNRVIYGELCCGQILDGSRQEYLRIIDGLIGKGAEGIVLGCTEVPLLVTPEHTDVTLFDTGLIHAEAAVEFALS
jgi:aspartate racemase